jgi:hypothetical protein
MIPVMKKPPFHNICLFLMSPVTLASNLQWSKKVPQGPVSWEDGQAGEMY